MTFDPGDLPHALVSNWPSSTSQLIALTGGDSPQAAYYRENRVWINLRRQQDRPSRARQPAAPRVYAGVPVVVRQSVRERIAEVRRESRRAR